MSLTIRLFLLFPFVLPHRQYRAMGVPHDFLGNAAHQQSFYTRSAVCTHHDQIGLFLFRQVQNAIAGRSFDHPVFETNGRVRGHNLLQSFTSLFDRFSLTLGQIRPSEGHRGSNRARRCRRDRFDHVDDQQKRIAVAS